MLSAAGIWSVNSVDLATLGVVIKEWPGLEGRPRAVQSAVDVAGAIGVVETTTSLTIPARTGSLVGHVVADTNALLLSQLDALAALMSRAPLTLIPGRNSTRAIYGAKALAWEPETYHPKNKQRAARIEIPIFCKDPRFYDVTATTVPFTTATAVPQGSAPTRSVITITGAASSPITITYKDHTGATILIVSVATALASGSETLVIDNQTGLITKNAGGASNVIGSLTTTSKFPFDFDPIYAASLSGTQATIERNGGTGVVVYKKAWWTA